MPFDSNGVYHLPPVYLAVSGDLIRVEQHNVPLEDIGGALTEVRELIGSASSSKVSYLGAGSPLPSQNLGPLWHEDYGGILTWQIFSANGANYQGYASEDVGMMSSDARRTPRRGWLERNGAILNKADYPALWNWALHVGSVGTWVVGGLLFQNTSSTTFRLPDTRGYFDRPWANGAAMDSGRTFGSAQADDNLAHTHSLSVTGTAASAGAHTHTVSGTGSGTAANAGAHFHYVETEASNVNLRLATPSSASSPGVGRINVDSDAPQLRTDTDGVHSHSVTVSSLSATAASNGAHTHTVSATGTSGGSGNASEARPNNTSSLGVLKF